MRRTLFSSLALLVAAGTLTATGGSAGAAAAEPNGPEDPAYTARDTQNVADAYGRITGPGGQLRNPAYLTALATEVPATSLAQLLTQVASPTRPAITPGQLFPGWNVGNPLRADWEGTRGRVRPIAFTNRFGALLRGHVYAPLKGAEDPYTGKRLRGPFPGVVLTEGSVQGSEGMYEWLAQDLAERGYVVLTYDVQGQGTSETLPHDGGPINALPFCNPFAEPQDGEMSGCPGVPSQQLSNFVVGTKDALSFFKATPKKPYRHAAKDPAVSDTANPFWRLYDRSRDRRTATPGRTQRIAVIGHSLGASAVSKVQSTDKRVAAVVALDKLTGPSSQGALDGSGNVPVVPALAVQSEYGFTVSPWQLSGGSSLAPQPSPSGPDPLRERPTGFDAWRRRRCRLAARRAPRLHPPRLHRRPPGAAGQPLRPGPDQRLRAALARPLPQAPRHGQASAQAVLPLPRAGRWWRVVTRAAPAGLAAQLLLLLGLLAGLASERRHHRRRLLNPSGGWQRASTKPHRRLSSERKRASTKPRGCGCGPYSAHGASSTARSSPAQPPMFTGD